MLAQCLENIRQVDMSLCLLGGQTQAFAKMTECFGRPALGQEGIAQVGQCLTMFWADGERLTKTHGGIVELSLGRQSPAQTVMGIRMARVEE